VGIGLARFAHTPLLPALITAGWLPSSQAACLEAANLAGYLAGALGARALARRAAAATVLRAMMVLVTVAFFAVFLVDFVARARPRRDRPACGSPGDLIASPP
jgi:fucose permease